MARITFSLEELIKLLVSNNLLPARIVRPKVQGDTIHFVIRTGTIVLPFIPASVKYLGLSNSVAELELTIVSSRLNKTVGRFIGNIESKLPSFVRLEHPKIYVDIDKLLKDRNMKALTVEDIVVENGRINITTRSI
ncbi:MAG: hypothetical protein JW720_04845 [Sedimentisphaerales bacterium]|nr:hypothetical protein [Sedimentisphaerales bacterium]